MRTPIQELQRQLWWVWLTKTLTAVPVLVWFFSYRGNSCLWSHKLHWAPNIRLNFDVDYRSIGSSGCVTESLEAAGLRFPGSWKPTCSICTASHPTMAVPSILLTHNSWNSFLNWIATGETNPKGSWNLVAMPMMCLLVGSNSLTRAATALALKGVYLVNYMILHDPCLYLLLM